MFIVLANCSSKETETEETTETTTTDDAQEGSPEACGNGICDSVEKEKSFCSADCGGESTSPNTGTTTDKTKTDDTQKNDEEQTAAVSEETERTLDTSTAIEILHGTLNAYDQIDDLLIELQTNIEAASSADDDEKETLQKEIDAIIVEINALSDTAESNDYKILHGTNQEILSATDDYRPAGRPWQRIIDAVNALDEGNQKVVFTYSFIIEGTEMENGESVELKDYGDDSVSNEEFKQEIREAITAWEELVEDVFNTAHGYGGNLEIIFTDLGDETGTSTASNKDVEVYEIPGSENLGDFRYGMEYYDSMVTGTPFSPNGKPEEGVESDSSGDVHYNSNINWRTDRESSGDATSVMIVTAHETGHGLAYNHEDDGLMAPPNIVRGSFTELFPDGLFEDDAVVAATVALYGTEAKTTVQTIVLEDGTELELPTVNAATLGVSAIKIRSDEEIEAAQKNVEEAITTLEKYKEKVEVLKKEIE